MELPTLTNDDYYFLKENKKLVYPTFDILKEGDILIGHSGEVFILDKIIKEDNIPANWIYSLKYLKEGPNLVPNYQLRYKLGGIVRYYYILPESTLKELEGMICKQR